MAHPFRAAASAAAIVAALTAGALSVGVPAFAATAEAAVAPAETSGETLARINDYFNGIRTLSGDFIQFGPTGGRAEGSFVMARPGKVRFDYSPPARIDIIADGKSVVVRDRKRATQDVWPLSKTPLRFLLADKMDLTSEANVTKVSVEPDLVSIVLEQSTVFGDGRLTMVFDRKTNELKQWTVTDAQGYDTSVAIYNTVLNQPVDEKLFKIDRTRILQ
jgi:outer membrane lipoprotein-sorting protein